MPRFPGTQRYFFFNLMLEKRKTKGNTNCYTWFLQYKLEKQQADTTDCFFVFTASEQQTKSNCSATRFSVWHLSVKWTNK